MRVCCGSAVELGLLPVRQFLSSFHRGTEEMDLTSIWEDNHRRRQIAWDQIADSYGFSS